MRRAGTRRDRLPRLDFRNGAHSYILVYCNARTLGVAGQHGGDGDYGHDQGWLIWGCNGASCACVELQILKRHTDYCCRYHVAMTTCGHTSYSGISYRYIERHSKCHVCVCALSYIALCRFSRLSVPLSHGYYFGSQDMDGYLLCYCSEGTIYRGGRWVYPVRYNNLVLQNAVGGSTGRQTADLGRQTDRGSP